MYSTRRTAARGMPVSALSWAMLTSRLCWPKALSTARPRASEVMKFGSPSHSPMRRISSAARPRSGGVGAVAARAVRRARGGRGESDMEAAAAAMRPMVVAASACVDAAARAVARRDETWWSGFSRDARDAAPV
ncbi:hypothetical protein SB85_14150 [Xanthomonas sacchari]|nr:hypothetical protein SB85_14150 [Xanthomonas sacchari]